MKIKILTTEDAFDPSAIYTDETYGIAVKRYENELEKELIKRFPDAKVEFFRSNNEYDAPSSEIGISVSGLDDYGEEENAVDEIQEISERVFETGNFWV